MHQLMNIILIVQITVMFGAKHLQNLITIHPNAIDIMDVLTGILADINTSINEQANNVINRFTDKQSFVLAYKYFSQVMRGCRHWNNPFLAVFDTLRLIGFVVTKTQIQQTKKIKNKSKIRKNHFLKHGDPYKKKNKDNRSNDYVGRGDAVTDICNGNIKCKHKNRNNSNKCSCCS
eukprot:535770_1